ncbi:KptA family-domain-containing protein [Roridomyces roridus]|uniref:2'-phosphotransferase n=1 Tax=Roridomyces roridus TaxID=1738132 RepID=A0AAD7BKI5_9AGAR|nr:KptA family-domain-containing protein [Roridomyces roridus]
MLFSRCPDLLRSCRAYSAHRVGGIIPEYRATTLPRPKRWPEPSPRSAELSRISRELAYLLRHGAQKEGLPMRGDGYVSVDALLRHKNLHGVDFPLIEKIVEQDKKGRYHLFYAPSPGTVDSWWIRANQGHSIQNIELDLKRIFSADEIPMAVHGTTKRAWESIARQGLSRMSRNHIHLAQGTSGDVISGMRTSSQVHIHVNVALALKSDIKFYVSSNGVVLTPGNEEGILERRFFERVESVGVSVEPVVGWEGNSEGMDGEGGQDHGAAVMKTRRTERDVKKDEERERRAEARRAKEERKMRRNERETSIRRLYTAEELELV